MASLVYSVVAQALGMDFMGYELKPNVITYRYIGLGLLARMSVASFKAKVLQLFDFPTDWPVDVRVYPTKKGVALKEYVVEVDVPRKEFEMK